MARRNRFSKWQTPARNAKSSFEGANPTSHSHFSCGYAPERRASLFNTYCYIPTLSSDKYSLYLVSQREKKIRRLHHIGAPAGPPAWRAAPPYRRTHTHGITQSPLPPALSSPLFPPGCRLQLFSVLSSSFLGFACLLSAGPARRAPDPKWSAPWHDFNFPALAFLLSWPGGCWTRAKPYAGWPWSLTSMMSTTLDRCSQHLALFPFSPCGSKRTVGGLGSEGGKTVFPGPKN